MLLLELDPSSPVPAYLQIRDRIVALIDDGSLRPGDRLPPTRVLAESVGVHRSTVLRAFDEIRALGYLESRSGSYTTVRHRARPPATAADEAELPEFPLIDWRQAAAEASHGAPLRDAPWALEAVPDGLIDFERLAADPALAPSDDLRRCLKSVLVHSGPTTLDYAEPGGRQPLRESISLRLRSHGVSASAGEILITNGAQQALDLVLRLLTRPGDKVVVEAPTYGMFHPLLQLHGLQPIEIPMRDDGMDLDVLEKELQTTLPRLLYTMPNFHNPTGVTTNQAHRERLLSICERRRIPLIEDGFEEEMKYFGKAVLPIKSMDSRGLVLYVGTFSKVVFPGLRVGWIAAHREAIAHLTRIQHVSCLAANTLAQAAAERFCNRGEFEAHLRRIHRAYRRRMETMLGALERHLPPTIRWTRPSGGYTLWLGLPDPLDAEQEICDDLAKAGVKVSPGRWYFADPPARAHLRLSIACVDEAGIEEGCRRLGQVLAGKRL